MRRLNGIWWNDTGHVRQDHLVATTGGTRLHISRPESGPDTPPTVGWTLIGWEDKWVSLITSRRHACP